MAELWPRRNSARRGRILAGLIGLLAIAPGAHAGEFEEAKVRFEQNATDGDVEVVFEVNGGDEGLARLVVTGPDGRTVADFNAPDTSTLGLRSFSFESPEPEDVDAMKRAYPEGAYVFSGRNLSGAELRSTASLSHALPKPAAISRPARGARDVPVTGLEIAWTKAPGAVGYILELEQDALGFKLTTTLPGSAVSFPVPDGLLQPGKRYQVGVGTVQEGGNVSFVESSFRTAGSP
jgi:hypothetical protein